MVSFVVLCGLCDPFLYARRKKAGHKDVFNCLNYWEWKLKNQRLKYIMANALRTI